jgi:hypothetical protein
MVKPPFLKPGRYSPSRKPPSVKAGQVGGGAYFPLSFTAKRSACVSFARETIARLGALCTDPLIISGPRALEPGWGEKWRIFEKILDLFEATAGAAGRPRVRTAGRGRRGR